MASGKCASWISFVVGAGVCLMVPAAAEPVREPAAGAAETVAAPQEASLTNQLRGGPNDVHRLVIDATAEAFARGSTDRAVVTARPAGVRINDGADAGDGLSGPAGVRAALFTSRVVEADFPFNEVVPSWNVDVPEGAGFHVELRVGRGGEAFWTPWYYLGAWGEIPSELPKTIRDEHGVVDVDYFRSARRFDRVQYRVHLYAPATGRSPVLRRFALVYSHTLDDAALAAQYRHTPSSIPPDRWARRLPVPFRSQKVEEDRIRGSICSPTSTAMVMEHHGVDRPTRLMADVIYDPEYRIYGNWARAVQGAWLFGVPGQIERFSDWKSVKHHVAEDRPVIASIRVPRGWLRGAPYRQSNGHLLVIVGFDEEGNVHVNDPAGETPASGVVTYAREDMERVWFGHGGIGYVLMEPDRAAVSE